MRRLRVAQCLVRVCAPAALVLGLVAAGTAQAQAVAFTGRMGERVLLVIDGHPKTLRVGESALGVRLVGIDGSSAQLEWGGERRALMLGAAPTRAGPGAGSGAGPTSGRIVLTASTGGHFVTAGSIGGHAVQFVVDTGATAVSMSANQAERAGVAWRKGTPVMTQTANGAVPAFHVTLDRVRVGDVELSGVDGLVVQQDMPVVLLGNSFLSRFQMQRVNDQMVLTRRY